MTLYWIRHCATNGNWPEVPLTEAGERQALVLADLLAPRGIRRVISSPYRRAVQSIEPFAAQAGLTIETDERLRERVLSPVPVDDRMGLIRRTFEDHDFCVEGGETGRSAADRAEAVVREAIASREDVALVSHRTLTALILDRLGRRFTFDDWPSLTTPDVYRIRVIDGAIEIDRLWEPG